MGRATDLIKGDKRCLKRRKRNERVERFCLETIRGRHNHATIFIVMIHVLVREKAARFATYVVSLKMHNLLVCARVFHHAIRHVLCMWIFHLRRLTNVVLLCSTFCPPAARPVRSCVLTSCSCFSNTGIFTPATLSTRIPTFAAAAAGTFCRTCNMQHPRSEEAMIIAPEKLFGTKRDRVTWNFAHRIQPIVCIKRRQAATFQLYIQSRYQMLAHVHEFVLHP